MTTRTLLLRTCRSDGASHGGFRWPLTVGSEVRPERWDPSPTCGNGLHGLPMGSGNGELLGDPSGDWVWIVFSAPESCVVAITEGGGGKSKASEARVEYAGNREGAIAFLVAHGADPALIVYGTATAGYRGTATAGDYGTATAGYGGTATAGDDGTATAGDDGTATAGDGGTATAGDDGIIEVSWWDEHVDRHRRAIAYVGEGGIKPGVAYRLNAAHEFVEARAEGGTR